MCKIQYFISCCLLVQQSIPDAITRVILLCFQPHSLQRTIWLLICLNLDISMPLSIRLSLSDSVTELWFPSLSSDACLDCDLVPQQSPSDHHLGFNQQLIRFNNLLTRWHQLAICLQHIRFNGLLTRCCYLNRINHLLTRCCRKLLTCWLTRCRWHLLHITNHQRTTVCMSGLLLWNSLICTTAIGSFSFEPMLNKSLPCSKMQISSLPRHPL